MDIAIKIIDIILMCMLTYSALRHEQEDFIKLALFIIAINMLGV